MYDERRTQKLLMGWDGCEWTCLNVMEELIKN